MDRLALSMAFRSLASLLRAGLTPTSALVAWPEHVPAAMRGAVDDVARRALLGATPAEAVKPLAYVAGSDVDAAQAAFEVHDVTGCDVASLLEGLARDVEARVSAERTARAMGAGAKLSSRMVAILPLAVVPLVATHRAVVDRRGALLTLCGIGLLILGLRWMERLMPRPPGPDDVAGLCDLLARCLAGGLSLGDGLTICCGGVSTSLRMDLEDCGRRVRLGAGWATALERCRVDALRDLAPVVRRCDELGTSTVTAFERLATTRRLQAAAAFDAAARRAPVFMVLPLVLCILPSFALLAIVPFVRSISFSG